jgi:uncharacterized SAM-binding protein YcdF (DUF218 family)
MQAMLSGRPRWIWIGCSLLCVGTVCVSVYLLRRPLLRCAGWSLVAEDPVGVADIVVVPLDANGGGVLEAADLVHSGVTSRVAVFAATPDIVAREFIRRGVPYEDKAGRSIQDLEALGVRQPERIPKYVSGSEEEGPALADWCDQRRFRSVIVVSSPDHSRRLRRVLGRAMRGHPTKVTVRRSRYSVFDPDRWWETHDGIRIELEESEKLLLDILRNPIS